MKELSEVYIGDDVEGYKYLGVLEADYIVHDEVKRSKKEYIRRVKKTLPSKAKC